MHQVFSYALPLVFPRALCCFPHLMLRCTFIMPHMLLNSYFMTVIKIYSKLEDLTAIFEHITATQQNNVLKISLTALEKKKLKHKRQHLCL